jgi:hypothetical protein
VIRTSALVDWLTARYADHGETPDRLAVVRSRGIGEELPRSPDRMVIVARTGGPGLALEAAFDVPSYQLRFRGAQNDPDDAEALADLGDRILIDAAVPVLIGGRHVALITRTGSPPTEDRRDPARRTHLTCNYLLQLSRYDAVPTVPPIVYP